MIWVLTAAFGDGHNTAARSVAEALSLRHPDEPVVVSDLIQETHPITARMMQAIYRWMIVHYPELWRWVYERCAHPRFKDAARWQQPTIKALEEGILRLKPRAIVSSFPSYAGLLDLLRQNGVPVPPLVTVVTDSVEVHPVWLHARSDVLCVPDEETKAAVRAIDPGMESMEITGFPVAAAFGREMEQPPFATPKVLYMPSTPSSHVEQTLAALLNTGASVTVVAGRAASRLYHTFSRFMDSHPTAPVRVLTWTNDMPQQMQLHHVLVCKAGGAITHEALAARIPVVLDHVVPGQEEGNEHLLLKHGCGLRSRSPEETGQHVATLLANDGAESRAMRDRMMKLSMPHAAARVAEIVDQLTLR